jgi:hypothetical protein
MSYRPLARVHWSGILPATRQVNATVARDASAPEGFQPDRGERVRFPDRALRATTATKRPRSRVGARPEHGPGQPTAPSAGCPRSRREGAGTQVGCLCAGRVRAAGLPSEDDLSCVDRPGNRGRPRSRRRNVNATQRNIRRLVEVSEAPKTPVLSGFDQMLAKGAIHSHGGNPGSNPDFAIQNYRLFQGFL